MPGLADRIVKMAEVAAIGGQLLDQRFAIQGAMRVMNSST
jgi:hypothetical protein